ncbi:hypothetical protein ACWGH4_06950 [Streptomyces sp. NPDC054847]
MTTYTLGIEGGPRGWLLKAITDGHLQDGLRALADPMEFAHVAADDHHAKGQLHSTAWLLRQLTKRRDVLIVALRDRRESDPDQSAGASWTDLVRLIDPDEDKPLTKRSKVQATYESGRRKVEAAYEADRRQAGPPGADKA